MSEIGKRLGQRVRDLRTQRAERLTQEELARRAEISVSFLSIIERGERVAHLKTFAALADALDVGLAELFSGVDQEPSSPFDLAQPLSDFCRSWPLSSRDIEDFVQIQWARTGVLTERALEFPQTPREDP